MYVILCSKQMDVKQVLLVVQMGLLLMCCSAVLAFFHSRLKIHQLLYHTCTWLPLMFISAVNSKNMYQVVLE